MLFLGPFRPTIANQNLVSMVYVLETVDLQMVQEQYVIYVYTSLL